MINEIKMGKVASYRDATSLQTSKKVNLIYGLNGTGKSTISEFLRSPRAPQFAQCSISPAITAVVLVYNQEFVRENFYESETLKGIFSLSKENKAAEQKISDAKAQLSSIRSEEEALKRKQIAATADIQNKKQIATDKVWEIKAKYTGGDRVMEYCLEGLKGQKDKLFAHITSIEKPAAQPNYTDEQLKSEVEALSGQEASTLNHLPILSFAGHAIEGSEILHTPVIGNTTSAVAGLINSLSNSNWVREGLTYIKQPPGQSGQLGCCRFRGHRPKLLELSQSLSD